ncbi:hypothetical protein DFJ74DRAFT_300130 [Hyaloraphidium curvatum]|nr:hypothetical protein DFJ74DRAFT_300130 [Hyaloraphidium curvatum]
MDAEEAPDARVAKTYTVDLAGRTPFKRFVELVESIARLSKRDKKIARLSKFIAEWRHVGGDFHPVMRLLLPALDRERSVYQLKEPSLAKVYVEVIGISKESADASALFKFKDPGRNRKKSAGDFAEVLEIFLNDRSTVSEGTLTIRDVNEKLDKLSSTENPKETQRNFVREIFAQCTAREQKWIARIILKDLKIGMTERTLFSVWHPMAMEMWSVTSSLRAICDDLYDENAMPQDQEVQLMHPFKPMLSERFTDFKHIPKIMDDKDFWVELKLDGERMQIHKDGDEYRYFSRNGKDYTYLYGKDQHSGTLTPFLHTLIHPNVESAIFDGEIIVFDPVTNQFDRNFGHLKTAALDALSVSDSTAKRPCLRIFDVVYVNGTSLEKSTLRKRREILQTLLQEDKGRVEWHPYKVCRTEAEVIAELDDAIMNNEEGIVIKNPLSAYVPGLRSKAWIKIKPDYIEGLSEQPDLLIVGGWYGSGRRSKKVSHYLCAIRASEPSAASGSSQESPQYLTICKIGSGFKFAELDAISALPWKRFNRDKPPSWLKMGRSAKVTPDVILEPNKDMIITVRAEKLVESAEYTAGYTLRFPRLEKFRDDFGLEDIWSQDDVRKDRGTEGRLNKRLDEDSAGLRKSKKRKVGRGAAIGVISSHALPRQGEGFTPEGGTFKGKTFYVLPAIGPDGSDADLRKLTEVIQENGGVLRNTPNGTDYIVADLAKKAKVANLIKANLRDIHKSDWVHASIAAQRLLDDSPRLLLHATAATSKRLAETHDGYGDSYVEEIGSVEDLKNLFDRVDVTVLLRKYQAEDDALAKRQRKASAIRFKWPTLSFLKNDAEIRYFEDERPPGSIFRGKVVYLDLPSLQDEASSTGVKNEGKDDGSSILRLAREQLLFYGAEVVERRFPSVTHVVVDPQRPDRWTTFLQKTADAAFGHWRVVTHAWVQESISVGYTLDETSFAPAYKKGQLLR